MGSGEWGYGLFQKAGESLHNQGYKQPKISAGHTGQGVSWGSGNGTGKKRVLRLHNTHIYSMN